MINRMRMILDFTRIAVRYWPWIYLHRWVEWINFDVPCWGWTWVAPWLWSSDRGLFRRTCRGHTPCCCYSPIDSNPCDVLLRHHLTHTLQLPLVNRDHEIIIIDLRYRIRDHHCRNRTFTKVISFQSFIFYNLFFYH